jgi:hypothetical protein
MMESMFATGIQVFVVGAFLLFSGIRLFYASGHFGHAINGVLGLGLILAYPLIRGCGGLTITVLLLSATAIGICAHLYIEIRARQALRAMTEAAEQRIKRRKDERRARKSRAGKAGKEKETR